MWKLIKERIHLKKPRLRYLGKTEEALIELIQATVTVWEEIEQEVLDKLVDSMPDRIQAVIDAKGWYTKY